MTVGILRDFIYDVMSQTYEDCVLRQISYKAIQVFQVIEQGDPSEWITLRHISRTFVQRTIQQSTYTLHVRTS